MCIHGTSLYGGGMTWELFPITGFLWGEPPAVVGYLSQRSSNAEHWCLILRWPKQAVEQTVELPLIEASWYSCNDITMISVSKVYVSITENGVNLRAIELTERFSINRDNADQS